MCRIPGRGPLLNVLAAAAVALEFDVPLDDIVARAASLAAAPRRGEVSRLGRGVTLVDDSYNSSPAALATRARCARRPSAPARPSRRGAWRDARARRLRRRAAPPNPAAAPRQRGVDVLVAVGGSPARALADAAVEAGMTAERTCTYFATSDDGRRRVVVGCCRPATSCSSRARAARAPTSSPTRSRRCGADALPPPLSRCTRRSRSST